MQEEDARGAMTVNERIKAVVEPIVPVCVPDFYRGDEKTYCTFNYDTMAIQYSDDEPQFLKHLIQIHLVAPRGTNLLKQRRRIADALFKADFDYPDIENASDEEEQHYVFETEYVEGVDENGEDDS